MTDRGTHLVVDVAEKPLGDLLEIVRTEGRSVRICVAGKPVAELSPLSSAPPLPARRKLEPLDPRLKVTFLTESQELTTEADWPEHLRVDVARPAGDDR
jgi:antitoxin (DNA-binding transcriptional repressor) of toxin-antitoxin stability system